MRRVLRWLDRLDAWFLGRPPVPLMTVDQAVDNLARAQLVVDDTVREVAKAHLRLRELRVEGGISWTDGGWRGFVVDDHGVERVDPFLHMDNGRVKYEPIEWAEWAEVADAR